MTHGKEDKDYPKSKAEDECSEAKGRDQEQETARTATATEAVLSWKEHNRFECVKSSYYHEDREHLYSRRHKFLMFLVTLSGTAAFASASTAIPYLDPRWVAIFTTTAGLLDVVYDPSGKAREHASLKRRFLDLAGETQAASADQERITAALYRLYSEEPTCYTVANAVAYNAAHRTLGRSRGRMLSVLWYRRLSRHWWPSPYYDPPTLDEFKERKSHKSWSGTWFR